MQETLVQIRTTLSDPELAAWSGLWLLGTILFTSRFYVQWYASEKQKRSVVPDLFWYLSVPGALLLLLFSFHERSAVGGLSYSFNTIVYARNLVHIWRDKGKLTRARSIAFQSIVAAITLVALTIVVWIWWHKIDVTKTKQHHEAVAMWLWIAVGLIGQGLFACRFTIQWIATELRGKSVMPDIFWHISLLAAVLLAASFAGQHEWLLAIVPTLGIPVYIRNIWLIHRKPNDTTRTVGAV